MRHVLSFDPVAPMPQIVALVLAAGVLAVWLCVREGRNGALGYVAWVLRGVVVVAICGLLLNPVMIETRDNRTGKPPLLVLVDSSHSMAVKDVLGKRRFDAAKASLLPGGRPNEALSKEFAPQFYTFAEDAARQDPAALAKLAGPDGKRTNIGEALARATSAAGANSSGGILLVSDGRNTGELSPDEVARQAKARGFPVFTICLGEITKTLDVSVMTNRAQVFSAPRQEVLLGADLANSGFELGEAQVRLKKNGAVVAEKSVRMGDSGHTEVVFPVKEVAKGRYRYTFDVRPLAGEATAINNRSSTLLTVAETTTHVLVLEARPSWDAKFLIQALQTDPAIRVDAVFKLSQDKYFAIRGDAPATDAQRQKTVKTPTTRAEFAKYDVVVLGKGMEEFVDERVAEQLKLYVSEDAGHLVLLRGKPEERGATLSELEPVTWTESQVNDFRMKLTSDGESHPAFGFGGRADSNTVVQRLPTLISATKVDEEKALSVVLARASGVGNASQPNREMAVLAYRIYGHGLVVSLIGEGLWQWAFLPPDMEGYADCYNDFWTQLARWLVSQSDFLPGQNLTLRTDHQTYSPGEEVNFMVFLRGVNRSKLPPLTVEGPDGKKVAVGLSKGGGKQADFVGVYRPSSSGDFTASLALPGSQGSVTMPFGVFERPQEDMNTSADPALMKRIAAAGGGASITLAQLDELPGRIQDAKAAFTKKTEPESLWDRWPVLAMLLMMLSAEWIIRRRGGMV